MTAVITMMAVLANLVTASRLICYRRGDSRYRPGVSLLAYLLIVFSGGQVIDTVFNGAQVTPWEAVIAVVIAVLVVRARGNVAAIVRCV